MQKIENLAYYKVVFWPNGKLLFYGRKVLVSGFAIKYSCLW
jgi:hypothetical protein